MFYNFLKDSAGKEFSYFYHMKKQMKETGKRPSKVTSSKVKEGPWFRNPLWWLVISPACSIAGQFISVSPDLTIPSS